MTEGECSYSTFYLFVVEGEYSNGNVIFIHDGRGVLEWESVKGECSDDNSSGCEDRANYTGYKLYVVIHATLYVCAAFDY